jgi:hypothetical protein
MCIGSAVKRSAAHKLADREQVRAFMSQGMPAVGGGDFVLDQHVDADSIKVFARLNKRNDEIVHSEMYDRATVRVNFLVSATWPEDPSPWVGRIDRFIAFEANRPGDVQPHVFRIAVMKLWRVAANNISSNRDVVRVMETSHYVSRPGCGHDFAHDAPHLFPTNVTNINCKLVSLMDPDDGHTYYANMHVVSRRF